MAINDSNKMPYLLAAGAIGGAIGFLFLTKSGQRLRDAAFNMETGSTIPDKIENARAFIEQRGQDVGNRLQELVDRMKLSFEEGRRVYEQGNVDFQRRMDELDRSGAQVVAHVHRAIDDFNRTIHNVEGAVLEPIYQAGAMVKAVDSGVRRMVRRDTTRRTLTEQMSDIDLSDDTPFYSGPQRVTG